MTCSAPTILLLCTLGRCGQKMGLPLPPALSLWLRCHPGKGRPLVFLIPTQKLYSRQARPRGLVPLPPASPHCWWELYSKCKRPRISRVCGCWFPIMRGELKRPGASIPLPLQVPLGLKGSLLKSRAGILPWGWMVRP